MSKETKKDLVLMEKVNFIGNFFKKKREEKGLSIKEVARLIRFKNLTKTEKRISEIENNNTIYRDYIDELSRIYEISFKDLELDPSQYKNIKDAIIAKNEMILAELEIEKAKTYLKIIDQLPLLYKNFDLILNDPTLYFIPINNTYVGAAYFGMVKGELVLGEILKLWKDGDWVGKCHNCGNETAYIFAAGGSPLSGSGSGWGVCSNCKKTAYKIGSFGQIWGSVRNLPKHKLNPEDEDSIKSFDELIVLLNKIR